jgi:hypothetical protein
MPTEFDEKPWLRRCCVETSWSTMNWYCPGGVPAVAVAVSVLSSLVLAAAL